MNVQAHGFGNVLQCQSPDDDWLPPAVLKLADRERTVASIVYRRGASTVLEIHRMLGARITVATVRKMLLRLADKEIVRVERKMRGRGQQCVYLPTITRKDVRSHGLTELAERYFEGSLLLLALEALEILRLIGEDRRDPEGSKDRLERPVGKLAPRRQRAPAI